MAATVTPQPTPNPAAFKFSLSGARFESPRTFSDRASAAGTPFAEALFELEGVASVFATSDFVTVTKSPAADWKTLIPRVQAALEQNL